MSKHTPGPWTWIKSNCSNFVHVETDTDHMHIATCNRGNLATRQANAAMIAAAPELLEAARLFVEWVDSGERGFPDESLLNNAVQKGRAAIAKAEGNA